MGMEQLTQEPFLSENVLNIPSARACETGIVLKELAVPDIITSTEFVSGISFTQ